MHCLLPAATEDTSEAIGIIVNDDGHPPQPLSNIPLSPEQRSHFPSQRQLEQDGYDSDQGIDQNVGIISEGPQEIDEEDIPEEDPSGTTIVGTTAGPNNDVFIDIPPQQLAKLKVAELKEELSKRGQPTTGLKTVLADRLNEAQQSRLPIIAMSNQQVSTQSNQPQQNQLVMDSKPMHFVKAEYTWTFYFRNQPAPRDWVQKGYSPLHARILGMFDQLEEEYHNCWFDNLYLSAKFAKASFTHDKKIRISGPTRKSGRRLPKCVIQEEKKNPSEIRAVCGTVKAAVLDGDTALPDLVAVSYYDQKPVHFLSTICESIKWIECTKKIYCVESEQMEILKFLRLNINDDYNNDMGGVDIANQLRNYYRFDHWMRLRKWWWPIFFWSIGILLVNSYVSYKTYMESIGKTPMSHYKFHEAIGLALIDPTKYWPDRMANKKRKTSPITETETNQRTQRKQVVPSSLEAPQQPSGCSSASSTMKKRATPVTDITLCPRTGVLRDRLRVQRGAHMPLPSDSKEAQCAMHRWATKEKKRSQILKCATCQIHLCSECYKLFHTVEEVAQLRQAYNTSSNVQSVTVASASNMTTI